MGKTILRTPDYLGLQDPAGLSTLAISGITPMYSPLDLSSTPTTPNGQYLFQVLKESNHEEINVFVLNQAVYPEKPPPSQ